jgi:hypothetical protein
MQVGCNGCPSSLHIGCKRFPEKMRRLIAGLFEALLTAEDAVISDQLNHASIIDGIRLCKAQRYRSHASST